MHESKPEDCDRDAARENLNLQARDMERIRERAVQDREDDAAHAATLILNEIRAQLAQIDADPPSHC